MLLLRYFILILLFSIFIGVFADEGCQYLIIYHPSLSSQVERLEQWRESQGLCVKITSVNDIYSIYPGLNKDEAIKEYVRNFYFNLNSKLKYLLLVGDACKTNPNKDLVPTHYSMMKGYDNSPSNCLIDIETPHDKWFGCLEGDDNVPEIIVGRIPVENLNELDNYVDKVINYETASSFGSWTRNALFLSDCTSTLFQKENEDIIENFLPNNFTSTHITPDDYWDDNYGMYGGYNPLLAEQLFIDAYNQGCIVTNYFGSSSGCYHLEPFCTLDPTHSNGNNTLEFLENTNKYSFMVQISCFNSDFIKEENSYSDKCISEELLLLHDAGAIACYGDASKGTGIMEGWTFSRCIYWNIFNEKYINCIGDIVKKAEESFSDSNPSLSWQAEKCLLMGDPAVQLQMPVYGSINGDVVWDSDLYITGDIFIGPGSTLTIKPGVTINFAPNRDDNSSGLYTNKCEIIVAGGELIVEGNEREPDTFHCREENGWGGIYVVNGGTCTLNHTRIRNAMNGVDCSPGNNNQTQYLTMNNCEVKNCYSNCVALYHTNAVISNTSIFGSGDEGIRIQPSCNVELTNCEIYDSDDQGIYKVNSNLTLSDCNIYNNSQGGIYNDGGSLDITGGGVYSNGGTGIYLNNVNANGAHISGTTISYNTGEGIEVLNSPGCYIYDCGVFNNSDYGIYVDNSPRTDIEECHIWGNDQTGVMYKDSRGGGPTGLNDEGTLSSYLGSIKNNFFGSGPTNSENLGTQTGNEILVTEINYQRTLEPNNNPSSLSVNSLAIQCENSTPEISGNQIEGYHDGIRVKDHECGNISGNSIEDCQGVAIFINHGDDINIQGNTIDNCGSGIVLIDDTGPTGMGSASNSPINIEPNKIEPNKLEDPIPTDVDVVGNNISHCSGVGISYRKWATGEITGNTLINIEGDNILSDASQISVKDNDIRWEGTPEPIEPYCGLWLSEAINAEVSGNEINNLSGDGIKLESMNNCQVLNNKVQNCDGIGVHFVGTSGVVRRNDIEGNDIGVKISGFVVPNLGEEGSVSPPDIGLNIIRGNDSWQLYLDSSLPLLAEGNCWGTLIPTEIDSLIYDDNESPLLGAVDFQPIAISGMLSNAGPSGGNFVCDFSEEPLYVIGDTVIPLNCSLTLEPGSNILFYPNLEVENYGQKEGYNELIVLGNITTLGSSGSPVVMKSVGVLPGEYKWGGMTIGSYGGSNPPENSDLEWLNMEGFSDGGLCIISRNIDMDHCSFKNGLGYGIRTEGSASPNITYLTLENLTVNGSGGPIKGALEMTDSSAPKLRHSLIINNDVVGVLVDPYAIPDLGSINDYGYNDIHLNGLGYETHYNLVNRNVNNLSVIGNSWGFTNSQSIDGTIGDTVMGGGNVIFEPYIFLNGHVDSNTSLSGSGALFTGDVFVDLGYTLQISNGCDITFTTNNDNYRNGGGEDNNKCELVVSGSLSAAGIQGNLSTFSCDNSQVFGGWSGIKITDELWNPSTQPYVNANFNYCEILNCVSGITISKNKINSEVDVGLSDFKINNFIQTGIMLENGGFNLVINQNESDWGWITGISGYALYNNTPLQYSAERIWWGTPNQLEIDALIYDNEESNGNCGAIDFIPYLMAPPMITSYNTAFNMKKENILENFSTNREIEDNLINNKEVIVFNTLPSGIITSGAKSGSEVGEVKSNDNDKAFVEREKDMTKVSVDKVPNTMTSLVQVKLDKPIFGEAKVKVYDISGRYIGSLNAILEEGAFLWDGNVEGNSLSSGVYIMEIKPQGHEVYRTRVVIPSE
jgi:parallel beta-helix repeat protein